MCNGYCPLGYSTCCNGRCDEKLCEKCLKELEEEVDDNDSSS